MTIQICANCDGVMEANLFHNCIRGLTDNINRLHSNLNSSMIQKSDHIDGLKYALQLIENMDLAYKHMGYDYSKEDKDPFNDMKNKIRMLLGMKIIAR